MVEWGDVATWAGGIGGIGGFAAACVAQSRAKKANELAKTANEMAKKAVGEAKEANRIAVQSNELAGQANDIAERARLITEDQVPYSWTLQINDRGDGLLTNRSAEPAHRLKIVIDHDGVPVPLDITGGELDDVGTLPGLKYVMLDLSRRIEQHFADARGRCIGAVRGDGSTEWRSGLTHTSVFRAHLTWETPEGVKRHGIVKESVSHKSGRRDELNRVRE